MLRFAPKRLEEARLSANMSRDDLAHKAREHSARKISSRSIRGYERGEYIPGADILAALAHATGRPLEFFYTDDGGAGGNDVALTGDPFRGTPSAAASSDPGGGGRRGLSTGEVAA